MTKFMHTITESGAGAQLAIHGLRPAVGELANCTISHARQYGFVLLRDLELNREEFTAFVKSAGTTAEHRFGTGSAELLDLNADPDPKKYVTGRAPLPLHTDGAFVGTHPSFIILYCAHIDQQPGDGETQLCDQRLAMASMPADLKELFSAPWEYMVHDASHFPSIASQWVSVPPVIEKDDGTRTLNMAMPFELGDPNPGWSVRISGKSTEESTALLRALDQYLKNSESFYSHRWRIGDLLILDNSRVLHGRSAITGARHLYRGQLQ